MHTRDADEDMTSILEDEMGKTAFPGVLHCFSSGRRLAERALSMSFHISLSCILTFKNAQDLRDIVKDVLVDRILVETDAPFLVPIPYRGKRNQPPFFADTAAEVAELKDMDNHVLSAASTEKFLRFFQQGNPSAKLMKVTTLGCAPSQGVPVIGPLWGITAIRQT